MEKFNEIIGIINDSLYTYILMPILLLVGIYFTIRLRAGQLTNIKEAIKLISKKSDKEGSISPFKAFTVSAASHIGTGNIVGVAAAISVGGPGAVFWMWVTALIGGASSFVENTLGQIFKEKNEDGTYKGGPYFYMIKTLKKPAMAVTFAIVISIVYGFMFNSMQANTISQGFNQSFNISPTISAIILMLVAGFVIFGGIRIIADITSLIVPVMALAYMGMVLFILVTNISKVPHMFSLIFKGAFNAKAGLGGLIGGAIVNGVRRGLFSNEAGMGAVPNASALADVSHPAKQGLIQALGVYLDTILVCSATAFVIILGGEEIFLNSDLEGLAITSMALQSELGSFSQIFLSFCILMFAFSSIIGNYYYGENNILSLGLGKIGLTIYRILVLGFLFFGSVGEFSTVWNLGDVFMGIMALLNLISLILIGKIAIAVYYDYKNQLKDGKDPVFKPENIKELNPYLNDIDCW